jgi:hypothetical protein
MTIFFYPFRKFLIRSIYLDNKSHNTILRKRVYWTIPFTYPIKVTVKYRRNINYEFYYITETCIPDGTKSFCLVQLYTFVLFGVFVFIEKYRQLKTREENRIFLYSFRLEYVENARNSS